jgi:hypothetical protein
MITERYTTVFYKIDTKFYTDDFVAYLWEQSANNEYKNSGLFIPARIDRNKLVCGEVRGCEIGEPVYVLVSVRNQVDYTDEEIYKASYLNVVNEVRKKLGNPHMSIAIEKVDYYYFAQT